MTPCASPQLEITFEDLSRAIIVSQGGKNNSSQNSRSSTQIQNQSPPTSLRGDNTQTNMVGIDNTLRLPEFKGVGSEDPKQHLFVCKTIWVTKNILDEAAKIAQLVITFRGRALVWYMKLHSITPIRHARTLEEIKQALSKEFKMPKSESKYISQMKEMK
jgi:hypothetical protein